MNHEDKNITIDLYGDGIGKVQLVQSMGTDSTIVRAARVSFGSDEVGETLSDKDKKLIKYLITHKHTSTLEHCNITFKVVVPLFVRSQHHRHRTWSYNEISRRYTDESLKFFEPSSFRTQHKSNRQASNPDELTNPSIFVEDERYFPNDERGMYASDLVREHHQNCLNMYQAMMDAGICREQARGILPQNLYTEYYASTNVNNLLKFVQLRMHEGAQYEIQKVAEAMLDIAQILYPETIKAYREINNF